MHRHTQSGGERPEDEMLLYQQTSMKRPFHASLSMPSAFYSVCTRQSYSFLVYPALEQEKPSAELGEGVWYVCARACLFVRLKIIMVSFMGKCNRNSVSLLRFCRCVCVCVILTDVF